MKAVKHVLVTVALAAAGALSLGAHAQSQSPTGAQPGSSPGPAAAAAAEMTEGEVRKIDRENKKITLKHGAIKNLDMPPMTMVFTVSDSSLLDKVQTGDKVRFTAANESGKFTLTDLQPVK
ncbi:copper-binding protein [Ramlibacter sp. AW1]|uniref:Copper-binding protein n=2 Tax=Ramlibacter aurantiacus TaxID=2801330 RepID=A0A937D811_9BURK|nr:copper-binding protein [Ramlibacter aurantiacus]MBL0422558.1 copper-binding protein [Ramlibacter aurantiacus]